MQASSPTSAGYRMAQKTFHCYACNKKFKKMTNVEDYGDVRCTHCDSDFFEEAKYMEQDQQSPRQEPQSVPQQVPPTAQTMPTQPRYEPQMPQMQQPQVNQGFMPMQGMSHQQTFTRRFSPRTGWTQSVTVSVGGQPGQQAYQVHQTNSNVPQFNMPAQPQPSAAGQQNAQQQQQQQPQGIPQMNMFDPFGDQGIENILQGVMGGLGEFTGGSAAAGAFGGPQGQRAPRGDPFANMFQRMPQMFFFEMPFGQQQPQSQGLTPEQIANLPEKPKDKKSDCYICLEPCKDGKESIQLPCEHAFDRVCIEGWLKDHDQCPACRQKVIQEGSPRQTFLQ